MKQFELRSSDAMSTSADGVMITTRGKIHSSRIQSWYIWYPSPPTCRGNMTTLDPTYWCHWKADEAEWRLSDLAESVLATASGRLMASPMGRVWVKFKRGG